MIFDAMIDFLAETPVLSIAFAQGGDYIGGPEGSYEKTYLRKCMNVFMLKTDRRIWFRGTFNDDVNTYVDYATKGGIMQTCLLVHTSQKTTQKNKGGLTDIYKRYGTYTKSFYTVIAHPECCKISVLGSNVRHRNKAYNRIHHCIDWNACAPKIVRQKGEQK